MKKSLLLTAFLLCCIFEKVSANAFIDAEEYLFHREEEVESLERHSGAHPDEATVDNLMQLRGEIDRIKEFLSTHPEYKTKDYNSLPDEVFYGE